jgi:excisionase family DNA binding protein
MTRSPIELMTTREAAALLRVPESTMRYWRQTRYGPRHARVGRRVLYSRQDVETWWERQRAMAS